MKLRFKTTFLAVLLLLMSFINSFESPVFAASDPLVVIAIDSTDLSSCKMQLTKNLDTSYASTTSSLCSPGTIISSKGLLLSQALKVNERYVAIPSNLASIEDKKKFSDEVDKLMQDKSTSIKANLTKSVGINTNSIACGAYNGIGYTWNASWNSTVNFTSYLNYQMGSDCSYVKLIYTTIVAHGSNNNVRLDKMLYASASWPNPSCSNIYSSSYYLSLNSIQSPGYYFQHHVVDSSPCWLAINRDYTNIGPVN